MDESRTRNSPLVPIFEDLTEDGRVLKEWELIQVAAMNVPKFRPAKALKDAVKG